MTLLDFTAIKSRYYFVFFYSIWWLNSRLFFPIHSRLRITFIISIDNLGIIWFFLIHTCLYSFPSLSHVFDTYTLPSFLAISFWLEVRFPPSKVCPIYHVNSRDLIWSMLFNVKVVTWIWISSPRSDLAMDRPDRGDNQSCYFKFDWNQGASYLMYEFTSPYKTSVVHIVRKAAFPIIWRRWEHHSRHHYCFVSQRADLSTSRHMSRDVCQSPPQWNPSFSHHVWKWLLLQKLQGEVKNSNGFMNCAAIKKLRCGGNSASPYHFLSGKLKASSPCD